MSAILVTPRNLDEVRESMAANDQRDEVGPGCVTWPIRYANGQRGQMTLWANGRGAVAWGGTSEWGTVTEIRVDDGTEEGGTEDVLILDRDPSEAVTMDGVTFSLSAPEVLEVPSAD